MQTNKKRAIKKMRIGLFSLSVFFIFLLLFAFTPFENVLALHSLPMPATGNTYTVASTQRPFFFIPANLDGDDKTDWITKQGNSDAADPSLHVPFIIEALTYNGTLLWKFDTKFPMSIKMWEAGIPAIPWDLDEDGIDEVVTVRYDIEGGESKTKIVILNGQTGAIKAITPIPWIDTNPKVTLAFGVHSCIAYLDGPNGKPSIIINPFTSGLWGVVFAYDLKGSELKLRWSYQHYGWQGTYTHGITSYDVDSDGRDDVLFGGTILSADGTQIFSLSDLPGNSGHVDIVAAGDIDPNNPGAEIFFGVEKNGGDAYGAKLTKWDGTILWQKVAYHVHVGYAANINNNYPGQEIRFIADNGAMQVTYTSKGVLIPNGSYTTSRPPEWTGDDLYDPWPSVGISNTKYAADLGGGTTHGAEEVTKTVPSGVNGDKRTLTVYFNKSANSYPSRWASRNYRKDVSAIGSGYTFRSGGMWEVKNPVAQADYAPTPYITIDGRRTINYRKSYTEGGNKVIRGQKIISLKGEQLQFRGSTSWDSDGDTITSYQWDFGDGQTSTTMDPIHSYSSNGTYTAKLTLQAGGKTSLEYITIEVNDQIKNVITAYPYQVVPYKAKVGEKVYIDTTHTITSIPASLTNLTYIKTATTNNNNRIGESGSGIEGRLLVFELTKPTTIYVAFDETDKSTDWPAWLVSSKGWTRTGEYIRTSYGGGRNMYIYSKAFSAGAVGPGDRVLGGNVVARWSTNNRSMYMVLIGGAPPAHCSNGVKDGDETDIDCGGSCISCCGNGVVNATIGEVCDTSLVSSCSDPTPNCNSSCTACVAVSVPPAPAPIEDKEDPVITITCPVNSATPPATPPTYSVNNISLSGTASDNVGVSKVEVKVGPAGTYQTATGTTSWSISGITLAAGLNTVYAKVTDTASPPNTKEVFIQVTYDSSVPPPPAVSCTKFVAKTGNDTNPGTEALPWLTIQKAADVAVAGDTVCVKEGTYNERLIPKNSGSAGNWITFASYLEHAATIDGTGITWDASGDGSAIEHGGLVNIIDKNYIKISGFRIINSYGAGVLTKKISSTWSHITVEKNYIYNTASSGIDSMGTGNNLIVDRNEIEMCKNTLGWSQECLSTFGVDTFEISNNNIHHNAGWYEEDKGYKGAGTIDVKSGVSNGKIYGNEIHHVGIKWDGEVAIYVDAYDKYVENLEIYNNNIHDIRGDGISIGRERAGYIKNILIFNNLVYNIARHGIHITDHPLGTGPMDGISIINNVAYNSNGYTFSSGISCELYVPNSIIRNNIVSGNNNQIIGCGSYTVDHNLYYGSNLGNLGTDYIEADPQFTNATGADFHLQSTSPAINASSPTGAPAFDFDNGPRPWPAGGAFDIGAYEYGSPPGTSPSGNLPPHLLRPLYHHLRERSLGY